MHPPVSPRNEGAGSAASLAGLPWLWPQAAGKVGDLQSRSLHRQAGVSRASCPAFRGHMAAEPAGFERGSKKAATSTFASTRQALRRRFCTGAAQDGACSSRTAPACDKQPSTAASPWVTMAFSLFATSPQRTRTSCEELNHLPTAAGPPDVPCNRCFPARWLRMDGGHQTQSDHECANYGNGAPGIFCRSYMSTWRKQGG